MSLSNFKKKQFMAREANYSTTPSRSGRNLLGWEELEDLTPEQQRACLVAKLKAIDEEIVSLPKNSGKRKYLGKLKFNLQLKINEIRPKTKTPGVTNYVMDVLREELSKGQFDILMRKAINRMNQDKQEKD